MSASIARKFFARVLVAAVGGEAVVIVRYRKPIAAVVPISRLSAAERASARAKARRRVSRAGRRS